MYVSGFINVVPQESVVLGNLVGTLEYMEHGKKYYCIVVDYTGQSFEILTVLRLTGFVGNCYSHYIVHLRHSCGLASVRSLWSLGINSFNEPMTLNDVQCTYPRNGQAFSLIRHEDCTIPITKDSKSHELDKSRVDYEEALTRN